MQHEYDDFSLHDDERRRFLYHIIFGGFSSSRLQQKLDPLFCITLTDIPNQDNPFLSSEYTYTVCNFWNIVHSSLWMNEFVCEIYEWDDAFVLLFPLLYEFIYIHV